MIALLLVSIYLPLPAFLVQIPPFFSPVFLSPFILNCIACTKSKRGYKRDVKTRYDVPHSELKTISKPIPSYFSLYSFPILLGLVTD